MTAAGRPGIGAPGTVGSGCSGRPGADDGSGTRARSGMLPDRQRVLPAMSAAPRQRRVEAMTVPDGDLREPSTGPLWSTDGRTR